MKNILIILPNLPYPLNSGGNIGVFEMINELRGKVSISLVVPSDNIKSYNELKQLWDNVEFHPYKKILNLEYRIVNSLKKMSLLLALFFMSKELKLSFFSKENKNYRDSIYPNYVNLNLVQVCSELINNNDYDYIQIEFYKLLPLINFLPKRENYIFVHHELRFIRMEREYNLLECRNNLDSYYLDQIKGLEIELLKKYNKIICLSDVDKQILSNYISKDKLIVSPLTIKMKKSQSSKYLFNHKLLFIGGCGHYPNIDGITWFIDNCWSKILNRYPSLKLEIIGDWGEQYKKEIKDSSNIVFHGFVNDLNDYFKDGILIVPIRIGSGMRMKIIDAVNYKIPFVTTTVGVEGIDLIDKVDCFIADESEDFVSKVIELVESKSLRELFVKNSFIKLKELYDSEKLIEIRNSIYNT